jgi:hypothetical protein
VPGYILSGAPTEYESRAAFVNAASLKVYRMGRAIA